MDLVLMPVDGSIRSEKSIEFASHILDSQSIRIIVFHVMEPGGNKDEAKSFVIRAKKALKNLGFKYVKAEIAESLGGPSEEILKMISRENIDLVIMSSYGEGRTQESAEVGDVVISVVNQAKCPIIVVK